MNITLRPGTPADVDACGRICFDAFTTISTQHRFPPDFPSADVAGGLIAWCLQQPDVYSVVAEADGRVVGSNFLWENAAVAGIGPITVDPTIQNASVGRRMMEHVLARAGWPAPGARLATPPVDSPKRFAGVRLVQAAFHNRSLSLYAKLGFDVREPLACMQGTPPAVNVPGRRVRAAAREDLDACSALCERIHGFARRDELAGAIDRGTASVSVVVDASGQEERISGYTTRIGFFDHTVGESNDDLKAMIGAAKEIVGPGMLVPTRNAELFRWCLGNGLRVTQSMTLMSVGLYQDPRAAWLPSVLY